MGIGGGCVHRETGEPLRKVKDANGDLFPVKRLVVRITRDVGISGCTVTIDAVPGEVGVKGLGTAILRTEDVVYHPTSGEKIRVDAPYVGRRVLRGYVWP